MLESGSTDAARPSVAVIVPCFNEAERLAPEQFTDFECPGCDVTFLFVDDGSTDDTRRVLERIEHGRGGRATILKLDRNSGKAEAVREGMRTALSGSFEHVGYWDADLATPLGELRAFVDLLSDRSHVDIVLGARVQLMGRDIRRRAARHYSGRLFATAASLLLGIPVYDTQCGAKLFRACPAVRSVFARPFATTWIFDVEVLARYLVQPVADGDPPRDRRIYELPLTSWTDKAGSKLRLSSYVTALRDLVQIWTDYPELRTGRVTEENGSSSTRVGG